VGGSIALGDRHTALREEGVRFAKQLMQDDSIDVLESLLTHLRRFNEENCSQPKSVGDIYEIAYQCMKEAAKAVGDESSVKRKVLDRLSRYFHIHEEVSGTHWSGKRMRIDAIITPIDDSGWKTKSPKLGIEFKNFNGFNPSVDIKDYTKWWAQCHDYAETNFDGHGYVQVFSYNGFSHYRQRASSENVAAFAVRFWGRLGVGEIQPDELLFVMNGTNKIWSERRGVIDGARIAMDRKFGSR
jgi:hypothetical protein